MKVKCKFLDSSILLRIINWRMQIPVHNSDLVQYELYYLAFNFAAKICCNHNYIVN